MDLMRVINTFLLWCALIFLVCGVLLEWFSSVSYTHLRAHET